MVDVFYRGFGPSEITTLEGRLDRILQNLESEERD
jgi:hypothetical protein